VAERERGGLEAEMSRLVEAAAAAPQGRWVVGEIAAGGDVDAVREAADRLRGQLKRGAAVLALKGLNFRTVAAGDSYNDTSMLLTADAGIFFRPPAAIAAQFPQFPITQTYAELQSAFCKAADLPD